MEKVCEKLPVPVATSSIKPVSSPSLQFGNISNFDESEHESDDGWSQKNEVKATPMRQCQMARDSWGDVWEDVAQVRCQMAIITSACTVEYHKKTYSISIKQNQLFAGTSVSISELFSDF